MLKIKIKKEKLECFCDNEKLFIDYYEPVNHKIIYKLLKKINFEIIEDDEDESNK